MKKNIRIIIFLAAFGIILGSSALTGFGQIIVGGYKSIAADDAGAVAAAEFAVNTQVEKEKVEITLDSILKAERQSVQGTNYKLCLEVYFPSPEEETDGVLMFFQAVVYQDLKGQMSLTSWTESDCAGNE